MVVNDIETREAEQCAAAPARTRCLYTRTVDVPAKCCAPLRDESGRVTSVVVTWGGGGVIATLADAHH